MSRSNRPARSSLGKDLAFILLAAVVVAIDQTTKHLIRANLMVGESIPQGGFIRLTYVTNTGGAFGLFANQTFLMILTATIGIIALILYYWYPPFENAWLRSSLALQLGGAVGNLIDRVRLGYVTDFIDVRVWPVFNIADSAIVVGAGIFIFFMLFLAKDERQKG